MPSSSHKHHTVTQENWLAQGALLNASSTEHALPWLMLEAEKKKKKKKESLSRSVIGTLAQREPLFWNDSRQRAPLSHGRFYKVCQTFFFKRQCQQPGEERWRIWQPQERDSQLYLTTDTGSLHVFTACKNTGHFYLEQDQMSKRTTKSKKTKKNHQHTETPSRKEADAGAWRDSGRVAHQAEPYA